MDWNLCIICQNKTREPLQCPAMSKRKDVRPSYASFPKNLEEFHKIRSVPGHLNVEELIQGQEIEHSLKERKALWHKTCRNSFSNANLERDHKQKNDQENEEENGDLLEAESTSSPVKARHSSLPGISFSSHCFFCESSDIPTNLHSASTLEIDRTVRECASLVNDSRLIGKLALGNMVAIEAKYHAKCLVDL